MANEVSIVVRAKAMVGQGLAKAERELNAFVKNAKHHSELLRSFFSAVAVGTIAIGTSVVAFAAKMLGAYAEEETALRKLQEAHRAFGEEVDGNVAREQKVALAIMAETNITHEQIETGMAKMRMLGITSDKLEDAAKAMVGFMYAGLGEEEAATRVAKVYQGNYDRLQMLIPALSNATTETQKAAIVNEFLARQYAAQKGQVDTVAGAWKAFKNAISEAFAEVGKSLAETGAFQDGLNGLKGLILDVATAFGKWAANGGIGDAIAGLLDLFENLRHAANQAGLAMIGALSMNVAGAATGMLKKNIDASIKEDARHEAAMKHNAELREKYSGREQNATGAKTIVAAGAIGIAGGGGPSAEALEKADKERAEALRKQDVFGIEERGKKEDQAFKARLEQNKADWGFQKELADQKKHNAEEIGNIEKALRLEALDAAEKEAQVKLDAAQKVVAGGWRGIVDAQKAKEITAKDEAQQNRRGNELARREARGVVLGKAQKEELEAMRAVQKAGGAIPGLKGQIALTQAQRDKIAQDALTEQRNTVKALKDHNQKLDVLLALR